MNNDDSVEAEQIREGLSREAGIPTVFFGKTEDQKARELWDQTMCHPLCSSCRTCSVCCFGHDMTSTPDPNVTGTVTFEQVAQEIYDEAFDLLVARQMKYGSTNIEQQGLYGVLVRIRDDKLSRIQRAFNGKLVAGQVVLDDIDTSGEEGDTLFDAYLDIANYAVISLMLLRGLWGKPLQRDVDGINE